MEDIGLMKGWDLVAAVCLLGEDWFDLGPVETEADRGFVESGGGGGALIGEGECDMLSSGTSRLELLLSQELEFGIGGGLRFTGLICGGREEATLAWV